MYIESSVLIQLKSLGATVVALFFFISGYGLTHSFLNKGQDYLIGFFNKRIWFIFKPFFLINIIYSIYLIYMSNGVPPNFFKNILNGTLPVFTSWYVVILTIQYILFYLIFKLERIKIAYRINIVTLLTILEILILYFTKYDRCWWVSTIAFPTGMYYRYYIDGINKLMSKKISKIAYMPIGSIIVGAALYLKIELLYSVPYLIIPLLVIIPICFFKDIKNSRITLFFNSISYEIYLVHLVVLSILSRFSLFTNSTFIYVTVSIILTVIFSYLFKLLCNIKLHHTSR